VPKNFLQQVDAPNGNDLNATLLGIASELEPASASVPAPPAPAAPAPAPSYEDALKQQELNAALTRNANPTVGGKSKKRKTAYKHSKKYNRKTKKRRS
jgi:hypothetical protein